MGKFDVTALGELLIDFTENGVSGQGNPMFEANPGGAPCNVLAMLSKLGHKTSFIGKVGKDFFGEQLKSAVTEVGIHADSLYMDEEVHTTLALVHTGPDGDRDFSFYRNPGADMMLTEAEIPAEQIQDSPFFVFATAVSYYFTIISRLLQRKTDFFRTIILSRAVILSFCDMPASDLPCGRMFSRPLPDC